jgi:type I restriction enzyme, S subunit
MREWWPRKRLGEVCQFRGGGTPSKAVEGYWQGNIPWVSPKDMKFDIVSDSIDHISYEAIDGSATSLIPKNSVLIVVRSGILARTIPIAITGRELTINQDLKALCPNREIDARFLYHLLSAKTDELLSMVSRGATVHRLMTDQIRDLDFVLPPLPEQQRIVALLDEAFAGLATARANAERNLQNARALFESHLQSVFSQRGEGWEENTMELSELCELIVDCEHKTAPIQDEGVPSIRTPNIGKGRLLLDGVNRVSEDTYKDWSRRAEPKPGDLILAREAPAGNVAVIPDGARVCLGQRTVLIRPKADIFDPFFLAYRLLEPTMQEKLLDHSRGATVQHVNMKDIRALDVGPIPPIRAQQEISAAINAVSAEGEHLTRVYERKLATLEELKKTLLHQAFNGEL